MTAQDIIAIISQGIVDGTDLDCTPDTQAREVLRQLRAAGVFAGAVEEERRRMMEWCSKRQKITRLNWERAARKALDGDMSELRNRIAMIDAGPMDIVLSDEEATQCPQ